MLGFNDIYFFPHERQPTNIGSEAGDIEYCRLSLGHIRGGSLLPSACFSNWQAIVRLKVHLIYLLENELKYYIPKQANYLSFLEMEKSVKSIKYNIIKKQQ